MPFFSHFCGLLFLLENAEIFCVPASLFSDMLVAVLCSLKTTEMSSLYNLLIYWSYHSLYGFNSNFPFCWLVGATGSIWVSTGFQGMKMDRC